MRVELLFPSEYLRAADLQGRDVPVTIAKVEVEDLTMRGGKKEAKPVMHLKHTQKRLVLNKTNALSIAKSVNPPRADGSLRVWADL